MSGTKRVVDLFQKICVQIRNSPALSASLEQQQKTTYGQADEAHSAKVLNSTDESMELHPVNVLSPIATRAYELLMNHVREFGTI